MPDHAEPDLDRRFFAALSAHLAERIPGFAVRYKDEDRGQRLLATLLRPIVPGYLENYTTTLYPRVYFPSRRDVERAPRSAWLTLAHEYVHLWDAQRRPLRFPVTYLMPQALAVGVVGVCAAWWTPWAWLAPLALVALAPWPSPGRTRAELRGYAMELAIRYWQSGKAPETRSLVRLFTGWAYYRMCPDRAQVERRLAAIVEHLQATSLPFDEDVEPYAEMRELMRRGGLLPDATRE